MYLKEEDTSDPILQAVLNGADGGQQNNGQTAGQTNIQEDDLKYDAYTQAIYNALNDNNKKILDNNIDLVGRVKKKFKNDADRVKLSATNLSKLAKILEGAYYSSDKNQKILLLELLIYKACGLQAANVEDAALALMRNSADVLGLTEKNKVLKAALDYVNRKGSNKLEYDFLIRLIEAYNDGSYDLSDAKTVNEIHDNPNFKANAKEYTADELKKLIKRGKKFSTMSANELGKVVDFYKKKLSDNKFDNVMMQIYDLLEKSIK